MSSDTRKTHAPAGKLLKRKNEHAKTIAERRNPSGIEGRRAHHADGRAQPLRVLPLERTHRGHPQDGVQCEDAHRIAEPQELRGILFGGVGMTDQISFLPMLDDAEHPTFLG